MNVLETYAIGSSKLTYDLIEKILKSNARLTLSVQAHDFGPFAAAGFPVS